MSNSVDPDETSHYLDLHCLQKPIIIACGSERVKFTIYLFLCSSFFTDVPSAPENLKVTDISSDAVSLEWSPSKSDGGAPIVGYAIERRDAGRQQWVRVTRVEPKVNKYTVPKLLEGRGYTFRVMAENEEGLSEPVTLDKTVVPEREIGK